MSLAALFLVVSAPTAQEISVRTLLPEMTSFDHLLRRPDPYYTMAQASSYDRKSNPGPNSDPFANGDAGQFLREEKVGDRVEYVMADLKGPGAVVRVWSANPAGTIRFYFDGEKTPRIQEKMADLLKGKVRPFSDPLSYMASMGTNLYFPFPYAKSLKVTVDNTEENRGRYVYYHIGYRTYGSGTRVSTFEPKDLVDCTSEIIKTRMLLDTPDRIVPSAVFAVAQGPESIAPGAKTTATFSGGGVLRELSVKIPFDASQIKPSSVTKPWGDPLGSQNVLRTLILTLTVDGKRTAEVPVGDFFSTAPGIQPRQTMPFEVRADGTMITRFPIPFRDKAEITLTNMGQRTVTATIAGKQDRKAPDRGFYTLHAYWAVDKGSTRPMRDMHFLNTTGEGYWVGSNLHIANSTPAWWGEGDEKVYVDGETFPSTFGTGTEDYYGYAWSSNQPFIKPYHSQPNSDRPGNFGHSDVNRWHIFDPISFRKSLKFDLEMWHWQECEAAFYHTAFWYAPPSDVPHEPLKLDDLLPMKVSPPEPVKGALEGEAMPIVSKSGGVIEYQEGFWELSGGKQLWWRDVQPGEKLVVKFPVKEAGRYEVFGNFCHARDYGIHKLSINGKEIAPMDFYGTGVTWKRISLGTFNLPAGDAILEVTCVGNRTEALPARMFGLDYLMLEKR